MTGTGAHRPATVVLAAGGTGGHMFPAQALARELLARGASVALITDQRGGGFEQELSEIKTLRISGAGVVGGGLLAKAKALVKLGLGYLQARKHLGRLKADAVVGFGGYASLPTCLAGAHKGLRVVIHEQNAVLGRANRAIAKKANAIATCFETVRNLDPKLKGRVNLTGNPVRSAIAALGAQPYAAPGQGDAINLLIVGGSQGARVFNDLMPAALCALPEDIKARLKLSQQVPGTELEGLQSGYRECGIDAELRSFFDDMPQRLKSAHLLVSRAGASTIAELAAAGRPSVMVPYPFAADDHQQDNAEAFAKAGGGWVKRQRDLTPEDMTALLSDLLCDPSQLAKAAQAARGFAQNDAAKRLADLVCDLPASNGAAARQEAAA